MGGASGGQMKEGQHLCQPSILFQFTDSPVSRFGDRCGGPVDVNYFYIVGTIGNPLSAVATSNP